MSEKWNADFKTIKISRALHERLYKLRDAYRNQTRRNITADEILDRLIVGDEIISNLYQQIISNRI